MEKKINILYVILLLVIMTSCIDNSNKGKEFSEEDKQYNVTINDIEYYRVVPFNENSKDVVYVTTKKTDLLKSNTYILDTVKDYRVGEVYIYDNGPDYFEEGLCRFKRNNKVGFLNKKGEVIIEPKYDHASYFINGLASVGNHCQKILVDSVDMHYVMSCEKEGIINTKGEIILPLIYNLPSPLDSSSIVSVIYDDRAFEINLTAYEDSLNELKLPYGTFYSENGELTVFPITSKKKKREVFIQLKNKICGVISTKMVLIEKGYTKRYAIFSDNFSAIEINSITPGLVLNDDLSKYCKNSWGTYYKDKSKLITKD